MNDTKGEFCWLILHWHVCLCSFKATKVCLQVDLWIDSWHIHRWQGIECSNQHHVENTQAHHNNYVCIYFKYQIFSYLQFFRIFVVSFWGSVVFAQFIYCKAQSQSYNYHYFEDENFANNQATTKSMKRTSLKICVYTVCYNILVLYLQP